jgi:ABC-type glycerol-3-phosphate transport system substrate-binding protein
MIRTLRRTAIALMLSAAPLAATAQTVASPAAGTATIAVRGDQPGTHL